MKKRTESTEASTYKINPSLKNLVNYADTFSTVMAFHPAWGAYWALSFSALHYATFNDFNTSKMLNFTGRTNVCMAGRAAIMGYLALNASSAATGLAQFQLLWGIFFTLTNPNILNKDSVREHWDKLLLQPSLAALSNYYAALALMSAAPGALMAASALSLTNAVLTKPKLLDSFSIQNNSSSFAFVRLCYPALLFALTSLSAGSASLPLAGLYFVGQSLLFNNREPIMSALEPYSFGLISNK